MKKNEKKLTLFLALALAVIMAFGLAACGGGASGFKLDKSELDLFIGDSYQLNETLDGIKPSGLVEWSSSDSNIAAVDASGKVTGVATGTATITAQTIDSRANTLKATCIVRVTEDTSKLFDLRYTTYDGDTVLSDTTLSFYQSGKVKVAGLMNYAINYSVDFQTTWSAEDGVLAIDEVSEYVMRIDKSSEDILQLLPDLEFVTVRNIKFTLNGDTLTVEGVRPDNDGNYTTQTTFGTYTLTAENAEALGITLGEKADVHVSSVEFNAAYEGEITMTVHDQKYPQIVVLPADAEDKSYTLSIKSGSPEDVIRIHENEGVQTGCIEADKAGETYLVVTTNDGSKTAEIKVTVNAAPEGVLVNAGYGSVDDTTCATMSFTADAVTLKGTINGTAADISSTYTYDGSTLTIKDSTCKVTADTVLGPLEFNFDVKYSVQSVLGIFTSISVKGVSTDEATKGEEHDWGTYTFNTADLAVLAQKPDDVQVSATYSNGLDSATLSFTETEVRLEGTLSFCTVAINTTYSYDGTNLTIAKVDSAKVYLFGEETPVSDVTFTVSASGDGGVTISITAINAGDGGGNALSWGTYALNANDLVKLISQS